MAAGLGFKDFVTGEVLTAADVDGYLMQGIWVFANATARDAAVTSPQEGNSCYLKDTDVIQVYSGSSWVTKSGGGAAWTTLASGSLSGTEVSLTGFTSTLTALRLEIYSAQTATATQPLLVRFNSNSSSVYESCAIYSNSTSVWNTSSATALDAMFGVDNIPTGANTYDSCITIFNYNETARKFIEMQWNQSDNPWGGYVNFNSTTAITSIQIRMNGTATFSAGTYVLRGQ